MTWVVPAELEEVVHAAAREVLGDAPLATAALVRAIIDRSKRYTSERDRAPSDPTADLAARAAFFTIADAMKVAIPLAVLVGRGGLPARRPLHVLDIGAGCGAMSLGLVAALTSDATGDAAFEITAIDRDLAALRIAASAVRALARRRDVEVQIITRVADVATTALPPAQLALLGSVLNELPPLSRLALVERALAAIDREGAVIIIEPALRETSRALHELRDAVLPIASVFAPCTRAGAPCPMLADANDWCHEDRSVTLPPRTAELAKLTHLRDSGLKFSYLVLRHSALPLVDPGARNAWRVVSAPLQGKGKLELYGCGDAGRVPIRLLKRNRSAANRAFEDARRGDVLVVDAPAADRVELAADTQVERITPSSRR